MKHQVFIGRKYELEQLTSLHKKQVPSLVVIKGRRRIGKSRLIVEFASKHKKHQLWNFSGLAPQPGIDDQSQRDHFGRQLASLLKLPAFTFHDWSDAFEHLSEVIKPGDIILLDEISWMAIKDPTFVPKLKDWWDKQMIPAMLVFCGSVSTWIEENILKSTAFFGRINLTINLEPLTISESVALLKASGFQGSIYDTYKLLSVFGGIPWYLQQVIPGESVDSLINQLCFRKDGLLVLEFDRIFHDLFNGKGTVYKKILEALKEGMKTLADVRSIIEFSNSGTLSKFMENLITAGFVKKQSLWSFKTKKALKQSLYRISDPYMRFYLKIIEPQKNKIELGVFQDLALSNIPGFDTHLGLQLEQLLLQNRTTVIKALGIQQVDIIADGPFRQFKTASKSGCQIDYLVQTSTHNLFVCEFKFKRRELGVEIIQQVQDKIKALNAPKGFACVPVLFHIGGVSSSVFDTDYFYRIIDISDFLELDEKG